jgi:hypothetical protein
MVLRARSMLRGIAVAAAMSFAPIALNAQATTDTTLGVETTDDNDGFDWGLLGLLGLLGLIPRKRNDVVVETRTGTTGTTGTTTGRGY